MRSEPFPPRAEAEDGRAGLRVGRHQNALLDAQRGWLAIDPKGVVGELAYEVGAELRNPIARPELFAAPAVIARRAEHFAGVSSRN